MLADTTTTDLTLSEKSAAPAKWVRVTLLGLFGLLTGVSAFMAAYGFASGDQVFAAILAVSFVLYFIPFLGMILKHRWGYFAGLGVGILSIVGSLSGSTTGVGIAALLVGLSLNALISTSKKRQGA